MCGYNPLLNGGGLFLYKNLTGFILGCKKDHSMEKKKNMTKIHVNLNPYYKEMVDHPEKISPRLEGETNASIVRLALDALLIQERNRFKIMGDQNDQGETG